MSYEDREVVILMGEHELDAARQAVERTAARVHDVELSIRDADTPLATWLVELEAAVDEHTEAVAELEELERAHAMRAGRG